MKSRRLEELNCTSVDNQRISNQCNAKVATDGPP
jgi:hypothetical protein